MTTNEEPVAPVAAPPAEPPTSVDQSEHAPEPSTLQPALPPAMQTTQEPVELTLPARRTLARWLLVAVALYVIGWLLYNALASMTPFILGLVLAYVLLPIVNRLDRKMPRWLAILTVYAGGVVLSAVSIA